MGFGFKMTIISWINSNIGTIGGVISVIVFLCIIGYLVYVVYKQTGAKGLLKGFLVKKSKNGEIATAIQTIINSNNENRIENLIKAGITNPEVIKQAQLMIQKGVNTDGKIRETGNESGTTSSTDDGRGKGDTGDSTRASSTSKSSDIQETDASPPAKPRRYFK